MTRPHDDRTAFRCSVAHENSAATLRIGRKWVKINVLDTSRSGFTIRLSQKMARKLKDRNRYVLCFAGETWEVQKKSSFSESNDFVHVGLSRVRDLTKLDQGGGLIWSMVPHTNLQADPAFLMFLMIAFLAMCVTLPGIGDKLGTAPKVRAGVHSVLEAISDFVR